MHTLRMILGAFIFVKGIQFESQSALLLDLINSFTPALGSMVMVHYVAMAHFAGGLLVFFGLFTRGALLFQLPIFIGAVAINIMNGSTSFELAQAIFGLVGCIAFIIYGSGRKSVDYDWKMEA
jgi:uncharacterized membrane protein YphA (DoxX/SURF4 family)